MKNVTRYTANISTGLTNEQIQERISENLINYDTSPPTKSIKRILYENFFTLFNILNLILGICVFSVGSYKNGLFLLIVILNTAISTIQEIRSKVVVDKLSVMASSKAHVVRDGHKEEIDIHDLVLDDILELNTGDQIATDCIILDGELEVNESFITGEPNSIIKKAGDTILSGSFVVSGKSFARVEHIAEENYASQISSGAKYIKKVKSEIMASLNKIIKVLTFAIVPIGILFFLNQLHIDGNTFQDAVVKSVAAIIGMIPEGLVLLTSTVLAVSVVRLSKSKVLVQELYCIETLARVDTLCLDKTGTLTEGKMEVKNIVPVDVEKDDLEIALYNLAKFSVDNNQTIEAVRDFFAGNTILNNNYGYEMSEQSNSGQSNFDGKASVQGVLRHNHSTVVPWVPDKVVPFSSQAKWSGIQFKDKGTYVMGAPEFVLREGFKQYEGEIHKYQEDYRVLAIAYSKNPFIDKNLPEGLTLIGFVCISDKIREDAADTLKYFKEQNVDIKIISGDNPITVSKIGKQVGLENYDKYIDMSTISDDCISDVVTKYTIFGRVSPNQKKLLIESLQKQGKTVAMTGDGVNDVLALKTADCSIAMANGSDASKNVSQLVLLDSNFSSMPKVVLEGRRTINNIERSASLFLVKTIYSCINAFLFLLIGEQYPFEPIQLSLISLVTIGIPSFVLALESNKEKISGNFLHNVISRALPTALCVVASILALTILNKFDIISNDVHTSLCVISTGVYGLLLLFTLTRSRKSEHSKLPFSVFRLVLAVCMLVLFVVCITAFGWWFGIVDLMPIWDLVVKLVILCVVNFCALNIVCKCFLEREKA